MRAYSIICLSVFACHIESFRSFFASRSRAQTSILSMKSGSHGEGFKYIPIHQAKELENFPRIVPIAGVYPDLSADDLLAPLPGLPVRKGSWTYDFSTPDGPQMGTVAISPSEQMTNCIDPVAVISTNLALGITNIAFDVEVVLVIDRGNREFKSDSFYAFRTPDNGVKIQWSDKVEPGFEILGKAIICTVPWVEGMKKKSSGFLEDDEDETE